MFYINIMDADNQVVRKRVYTSSATQCTYYKSDFTRCTNKCRGERCHLHKPERLECNRVRARANYQRKKNDNERVARGQIYTEDYERGLI